MLFLWYTDEHAQITRLTQSPAQGGLEGSRPSKNLSFWWSLPALPATTTRKERFSEGLQPSKPASADDRVSPVIDTSYVVARLLDVQVAYRNGVLRYRH